jgi:hypothetical protein
VFVIALRQDDRLLATVGLAADGTQTFGCDGETCR